VFYNQAGAAVFYLGFFAATMAIGFLYYNHKKAKGGYDDNGNAELAHELDGALAEDALPKK
jgi:hypothetical protein